MKLPMETYLVTIKNLFMTTKLFPIAEPKGGAWLSPESACKYFRQGRGIHIKSLMNKLYAGKLGMRQRNDHTGWYVWISDEALNVQQQPLAA